MIRDQGYWSKKIQGSGITPFEKSGIRDIMTLKISGIRDIGPKLIRDQGELVQKNQGSGMTVTLLHPPKEVRTDGAYSPSDLNVF